MIFAMFRVAILGLLRDHGALAMAFLLPPAIFLVFAATFSGTSGDELTLRAALAVSEPSPLTQRLESALRREPSLRILENTSTGEAAASRLVESGEADAGIVLGPDVEEAGTGSIVILVDPAKLIAGSVISGQIQKLVGTELPDLALSRTAPAIESAIGGFTAEQSARLAAALDRMRASEAADSGGGAALVATRTLGQGRSSDPTVGYYAGAVTILFLLLSAVQGAAALIEERQSGIIDRLATGPGGTDVAILGRLVFLTCQGVLQAGLIFAVAAIAYDVRLQSHLLLWLPITIAASLAAASVGLAVAALCRTRHQANTIATFLVLVSSAVGGSMVPLFMMPPWLQDIGWYTPNAWTIDAYQGVLQRGETLPGILPELAALAALAGLGIAAALMASRWRLKL